MAARTADPELSVRQAPDELRRRDELRRHAMLRGDCDALDDLLHDELIYLHSSGTADGKQTYLRSLRDGMVRYEMFEQSGMRWFELAPTVYLVNGRARARVAVGRRSIHHVDAAFTAVWVKFGDWRMVSWQSTPWPD